ncbi:MAG: bifunctional phosphoribosylaminoimidazolecarboxamide formyltransferase/IMP cyclohydrolase [Phycisphaeraceae bacterium]
MSDLITIKRALLSVSDKTDLVAFARKLAAHGVALISTGGTAKALRDAGLQVTAIEDVTGFPEMMDGRVKTLHPKIHGGLLALRDKDDHLAAMKQHGIEPIDLVCVNLYPFERTIAKQGVSDDEAIEQIDIGGPSMVRSAAKNHPFVTVVTDPAQYDRVSQELDNHHGATSLSLRKTLCAAAFARTAAYDTAIASWLSNKSGHANLGERDKPGHASLRAWPGSLGDGDFPQAMVLHYNSLPVTLRYGENPHQRGAVYADPRWREAAVVNAKQLHGIPLSFCNLFDADGALELVKEIDASKQAAAAVIKHANACGFAVADDLPTAFQKAYEGDPLAAFGGIIALNRKVDLATAQRITAVKHKLDVILAPSYEPEALRLMQERWKNTRLLEVGDLPSPDARTRDLALKQIAGGMLVQDKDLSPMDAAQWRHAAGPAPSAQDLLDLKLAMTAVKHLKSNAVCLVKDAMLVGAGAGQMDRLACCRIAVDKAGDRARGAAAASDAFFPFRDGPDILINAGITRIVQPGGSVKDADTIAACNDAGVTMLLTGQRHFRH